MPFRPTIFIVYSFIHCGIFGLSSGHHVDIENDGPVTLDVPVTIIAHMSGTRSNASFIYIFEDDIHRVVKVIGYNNATAVFIFGDKPGVRTIQVYVHLEGAQIASAQTMVSVHEFIPGIVDCSGTVEDKDGHKYIGTGWSTNISLQLQYPAHVMRDAEFAYSWHIGEDRMAGDQPYLTFNFQEPGTKWIRVAVVGRIPSYNNTNIIRYKWGYFDKEITVQDPFYNLNISGNTYLEHGQLLDLIISCNGSGPVDYCWKLLPPSEKRTNLSCSELVTSTDCSIPILYYFRDSGEYQLAIYVTNLVSSLQRTIQVHIYDVSLRPQLSMVILPIVCTIMVVVIIASGVIVQMRRRRSYSIETADFDFMKAETTVAVETSWEHMWRSLRCICYSMDNDLSPIQYGTILRTNQP